jgi:hypothetical protein
MTRKEVEEALSWALGEKIFESLVEARVGLPTMLDMAARRAFMEDWNDEPHLDKIRGAMLMLHNEPGHFTFEEE